MPSLFIGNSAFSAARWEGSFYPEGMKPADYLSFYTTKFNSVEVDSTFYRTPSKATVQGWGPLLSCSWCAPYEVSENDIDVGA